MENIRIQTSQNVDIEYELASIGDRILATLLDYVFFVAYFLVVLLINTYTKGYMVKNVALIVIWMLPVLLYDLVCEASLQGRSFGKIIMKIKVVKVDGTPASFGAYLLRWLLRIIDTRLLSGGVALIAILINGKGQRVGDMAAGTTVIKLKHRVSINDTILNKPIPEYQLVFQEVSKLTDNDIAIIKEVMLVSLRTNNTEAIDKLAKKTKAIMNISSNLKDTEFLATVVQDYSFYNFDR